ncbi:MAG: hypothetical protein U0228_26525 [Myxococcaceae bacterium]
MTVTRTPSRRVSEHPPKKPAATQRTTKKYIEKVDLNRLPPGMNPELAQRVRKIGLTTDPTLQPTSHPTVTHCNQAADKYAVQFGYKGFQDKHGNPMVANDMFRKMNAPGSGWKKVSAAEAIQAAKDGKLCFAAVAANGHGHIAAVTGEWAPGVPGISQAGSPPNFEFGTWRRKETPTYFVRE